MVIEQTLARLGLTEEDVPKTWAEFFGSLEPLAAKIAEEPGMTLFEGFSDYETARMTFLSAMIADYMDYISLPENEFAFDTEAFRAALAAPDAPVIATGTLPPSVRAACGCGIDYRETLILDGLYQIWQRNARR